MPLRPPFVRLQPTEWLLVAIVCLMLATLIGSGIFLPASAAHASSGRDTSPRTTSPSATAARLAHFALLRGRGGPGY